MMRTKIFVMTHKKFTPPKDPIYIPLQVGRFGKEDLGYLGDDVGDSISERNAYYGELTGMYWLWKNYTDVDVIGVCHYRRYFFSKEQKLLRKDEYEAALERADMLVSDPMTSPTSYLEYFGEAHRVEDMLLAGKVIKKLFPQDYWAFAKVMKENKYYFGNLCVMKKDLYDQYCEWLFTIFFDMESQMDVSSYDDYHKRVFGFLSEELLLVFATARGLKIAEGHIGITAEKAETVELKLAMGQLVKLGQFMEARQLFYEFLKIRPDVQLQLSDIKNEIPDIERILFILEQEQLLGIKGMYEYSHDLVELIGVEKEVKRLLEEGRVDEEYMKQHYISDIARGVIKANI